jgi:hypothetical protein|tara:strand:- start:371 stop:589 length:219 start_codon:yes stop_codon:yes gene_type:complete
MSYYSAKVSIVIDTPKGVKKQTEMYLVDAQSVTHAEAMVVKDFEGSGIEFEVKGVTNSKIAKVIEVKRGNRD